MVQKLTEEQVLRMRQLRASRESVLALAAMFKVSSSTVSAVTTGQTHAELRGPISPPRTLYVSTGRVKRTSPDVVLELCRTRPQVEVARMLGVSRQRIHQIVKTAAKKNAP